MRFVLLGVLVAMAGVAARYPAAASDPSVPAPQACVVREGWWVDGTSRRLFKVDGAGAEIAPGALPATPCGTVSWTRLDINGPPCSARSVVACATQVDIFFVTSTTALLSARIVRNGSTACSDTCVVWDAVPAHADTTVAVQATAWSALKHAFR